MKKIVASIMCANPLKLGQELAALHEAGIDWLHCDVMDGDFVENMAMAPYNLTPIVKTGHFKTDVHLAVAHPERVIPIFTPILPDYLTIHIEVAKNPQNCFKMIRDLGIGVGLALNPETPVEAISPYLEEIDLLLVMTVNPGFAGQEFNSSVLSKLKELNQIVATCKNQPLIQVDGNIYEPTIAKIQENGGADLFVVGTAALFNDRAGTYKEKISQLNKQIGL